MNVDLHIKLLVLMKELQGLHSNVAYTQLCSFEIHLSMRSFLTMCVVPYAKSFLVVVVYALTLHIIIQNVCNGSG